MKRDSKLPTMAKAEEEAPKFDDKEERTSEKLRLVWIVVLAFVILAVISTIVWFVFSGREDQGINRINNNNQSKINEQD